MKEDEGEVPKDRVEKLAMNRYGDQHGGAAVELALLLPLLVVLLFGIIDFGLGLYRQEVITNASREAARAGIMLATPRPTVAEIENVVASYLTSAGWDPTQATVTVAGAGGNSGDDLTVTVNFPYPFFLLSNLIPSLPDSMNLSANTVMKLE